MVDGGWVVYGYPRWAGNVGQECADCWHWDPRVVGGRLRLVSTCISLIFAREERSSERIRETFLENASSNEHPTAEGGDVFGVNRTLRSGLRRVSGLAVPSNQAFPLSVRAQGLSKQCGQPSVPYFISADNSPTFLPPFPDLQAFRLSSICYDCLSPLLLVHELYDARLFQAECIPRRSGQPAHLLRNKIWAKLSSDVTNWLE